MIQSRWLLTAALAGSLLAAQVQAVTYIGSGGAIPDATTDNSPGNEGAAAFDIFITDVGTITDITVSLDISHAWIGDLIAYLEHVDTGTVVDLFSRVGKTSLGSMNLGDASSLDGVYSFNDAFTGDFWAAAAAAPILAAVAPGDYFPSSHTTPHSPGGDPAPSSLAPFLGQSIAGTWRLHIEDWASGDSGSLAGWELTFDLAQTDPPSSVIPEPLTGTLGLLGLTALSTLVLRRRA